MVQSIFAKIRYYKDKVASCDSAVTEVNELKNICIVIFRLTFQIFGMQIFDIYNLNSLWQN